MRQLWVTGLIWAALSGLPGTAGAATEAATGVLDRLSTPIAVPIGDDRRAATSTALTADPIAVPTPTAATSGLLTMAGLVGWRVVRRVNRQTGISGSGR